MISFVVDLVLLHSIIEENIRDRKRKTELIADFAIKKLTSEPFAVKNTKQNG
jgi:hypothetical protein